MRRASPPGDRPRISLDSSYPDGIAKKGAFKMAKTPAGKSKGKPVAVVVGATSKWQSDGRNTKLIHGKAVDDSKLPVGIPWGAGAAIAQKFAAEGVFVVMTNASN